jgi:hypothetical protein
MNSPGNVLDAQLDKLVTHPNQCVYQTTHVWDQDNTSVSTIQLTVVDVQHAHQVLATLSELTELAVIESRLLVTASPDLMSSHGNVLDAQLDKEVQLTKSDVKHLTHVQDQCNILVSMIPLTVVLVESANPDQDG